MENPCLRPATIADVCGWASDCNADEKKRIPPFDEPYLAIYDLYTAEWRKRGFERSP